MRREDHTGVRVRYRSHRIQVSISHDGPAYIGEEFPIEVDVTNTDDRELDVTVDVLLQPTEIDEAGASSIYSLYGCALYLTYLT